MSILLMVVLANIGLWKGYPDDTWSVRIGNLEVYFFPWHSAPFVTPWATLTFVVKSYFAPMAIDTVLH